MKLHSICFLIVTLLSPLSLTAELINLKITGSVPLTEQKKKKRSHSRYDRRTAALAKSEMPKAIVYLEGEYRTGGDGGKTAEVAQKDLQFMPQLIAVQKGTTVSFPNQDDEYHSVFSFSKSGRFDLGRYRKDDKPGTQTFDTPGVVKVFCEIHPHMRSTIVVLNSPHFVMTDEEGGYALDLKNLAAGTYTLKAWVSEKQTLEQKITVTSGKKEMRIDFKS